MAKLSRRRPRRVTRLLAVLGLALAPNAASAVDLVGTWHVLVHYTDDNTTHPDQERWIDFVWIFEPSGSRLKWTEYPITVFSDETGRFERRSTGQYARVLGSWEPSEAQRANIRSGLKVNDRGSKKKTLRGSEAEGWRTHARARASSASIITFTENWSVTGLPDLPVFQQHDVMGSGRSETMDGVTRYTASAVEAEGSVIVGSFERDGTRHGIFRLTRSGEVGQLEARSQAEIQRKAAIRSLQTSQALRKMVHEEMTRVLEKNQITLTPDQMEEIITLGIQLAGQGLNERRTREEIERRLREMTFPWVVDGAEHDDSTRYRFPFVSATPVPVVLDDELMRGIAASALGGRLRKLHTVGFVLPVGAEIVAARAGRVVQIVEDFDASEMSGGRLGKLTIATVLHEDGTFAIYVPLASGIPVVEDQEVAPGSLLGLSTLSASGQPAVLWFGVYRAEEDAVEGVRVRFDDGSADGVIPEEGKSYGAGR